MEMTTVTTAKACFEVNMQANMHWERRFKQHDSEALSHCIFQVEFLSVEGGAAF